MQHRGLQSGEGELESVMDHGPRKVEAGGISFAGELLDRGAAGISQPEESGDFIEPLARRVVAGFAEQAVPTPGWNVEQQSVPARHEQRRERRREIAMLEHPG